ncbi:MAG TPA: SurA N-terminal domain-containing protein [Caulobacteraceae bacterium]|jgi:peptidyl-prolyl cis-trans isomerase D
MLSFFRNMAKSKIVWIVLFVPVGAGLLTIGNVRQDLSGLFSPKDAVIQAGSRVYTSDDFKKAFDNYRRQATQQGQQFSPDDAVASGLDQQMLTALSQQESFSAELAKLGLAPSAQQVFDEAIAKEKAFQDPVTGKFDKRTYAQVLGQNQLTPAQYEKAKRDELTYNQFGAAAAAGFKPPRLYGALLGAYEFETHDLSLFALKPDVLGKEPTPTDDDLKKLLKDNASRLTVPETRQLTVVKFSAAALAPTITADPAEVKKRYDFRKDSLSQPEKRSIVQISAKDAAQASDISTKLKSGQDPAAVAKAEGLQTPLVYTDTPKTGVADSKVGEAAFALPAAGAVSNPIQGNLGWAVIKVTAVTPAKVVTFDDAKAKIEDEVKTEAAATKAYDLVQKYQAAHDKGSNLTESAKAAGVAAQTFAPATAQGTDDDGKPVDGLTPRILKEAFQLSQGGDTDVIQDTKGEYFAVRADKVIPPTLPSLDKLRPQLVRAFLQREMSKRLEAKLTELAARVKKGESLDAVAKSVGSDVTHLSLNRQMAEQNRNVPPQLLQQILTAKTGDVVITGSGVAKVDAVKPPPAGIIAAALPQGQLTFARAIFEEIEQEGRAWAKDQIKPKTNLALARQAIGATDKATGPAAPASSAPPAGKAK